MLSSHASFSRTSSTSLRQPPTGVLKGGPSKRTLPTSSSSIRSASLLCFCSSSSSSSSSSSRDLAREEEQSCLAKRVAQAAVTTATCATLLFGSGLSGGDNLAFAVSGGRNGNNSTPISNTDFSGQSLTDMDFTKTIMKQCNFDKANLRGVSFFASFAEGSTFRGGRLELC